MEENAKVLIKTEPQVYVERDRITVHVSIAIPDCSPEEHASCKVKPEYENPSSWKDVSGESVTDSVHIDSDDHHVTNVDDVTFTGDDVTYPSIDEEVGTSGLNDETNSNLISGTCGSVNISGPDGQFFNGSSEPFYFIQNGRLKEMKVKCEMQCKICGRHFPRMSNLRRHLRTHTGEKPYKCDQCDRSFSQRSHLNSHMIVHSGEKPFECNICGRRFARQNSCAAHMTLHTGDKPHKCDYCEKSFTRKQKLTEHIRGHNI